MSTSRRTRSLRRARASESLRASASLAPTLTSHVPTPSGYASTSLVNASTPIENASTPLRIASDHPPTLPVPTSSLGSDAFAPRRRSRHATSQRRSRHVPQAGGTSAPEVGGPSASQASGHNRPLSQSSGKSSERSLSADGLSSHMNGLCIYADSDHVADGSTHADYVSTRANHGSSLENDPSFSVDLLEDTSTYHFPRRRVGLERHFRALGLRVVKDALLALLRQTMRLVKKRSLIDVQSLLNLDPSVVQGAVAGDESGLGGDEHSALVASTPSLSSELRDWVAWYRAGLLGSSSDLGESGGGLEELTGVLDDGTGGLDDDVLGAPGDRSDGFDDHTDALDGQIGALDEHTAAIDDFTSALEDDDSTLDEYTDALEVHTGDLFNDAITTILRFNEEAIKKARISLGIYPSFNRAGERPLSWVGGNSSGQKGGVSSSGVGESVASGPVQETGSLPDPSWGVWRREAWYVAEDEGPSNGRRETSTRAEDPLTSTTRKLGPSTSEYEPGASTSTRELGNSMLQNEIRPTPSPAGTPASHDPPSPVFDSPETFSTRRTTPSPTKVALPHASPTARRPSPSVRPPSPSVRRPPPRRHSSLVPHPVSTRPHRSSPQGNANSHQGSDGQRTTAKESACRRWSSPPYFGSSTPTPPHSRPSPPYPGPPPSISIRHSSLIRNVLDALPALSRGRSVPPRATIPTATASNATSPNATNPNAPTSNRATSSGTEASIYPSARAATFSHPEPSSSHPVPSSSRLTSTSKPADAVALKPADAENPQARDFEILLSPPSSLRALPSLTLGDVPLPARPPTFKLSQVPVGLQTALREAEHLARGAKEGWSSSTSPDDALRRAALDDIARAIHDTRRMLHKYKTTEIKLDKDPKRTDAKCYTEGLTGMMGTCAAFVHGMARDPRACDCAWLCDVRDCVVAHEARIRSAIHALANHEIQARLAELEDLALSMI